MYLLSGRSPAPLYPLCVNQKWSIHEVLVIFSLPPCLGVSFSTGWHTGFTETRWRRQRRCPLTSTEWQEALQPIRYASMSSYQPVIHWEHCYQIELWVWSWLWTETTLLLWCLLKHSYIKLLEWNTVTSVTHSMVVSVGCKDSEEVMFCSQVVCFSSLKSLMVVMSDVSSVARRPLCLERLIVIC